MPARSSGTQDRGQPKGRPEASRSPSVHVLKATLLEIAPPVWRRLEVPSDVTLARLHRILQAAMGWEDYHLHEFAAPGGERFGDPDPDDPDLKSDRTVRLAAVAPTPGSTLAYLYDFGDGWEHELVVEAVRPAASGAPRPACVAGERACPPEDCGGPLGYADMLEVLFDPHHEEHAETLQWLGDEFDPAAFDVAAVNARLGRIR